MALLTLPLSMGWAQPSVAAKETRQVLVLFSQERGHPAHELTEQGIRQAFRSNPAFVVELYIEYLDVARFSDPSQAATEAHFLRRKYAGIKLDAIIAVYPAAVDFLLGEGNAAFPRVPIVACIVSRAWVEKLERSPSRRYITGVMIAENTGDVLEAALRMRPSTKRVALVAGVSRNDVYAEQVARRGLEPYAGRLELIDLTKLSMDETLARVATLPPDTIVLYSSIFQDGAGRSFVPREALQLVSRAANAPVFGLHEVFMGYGIVGGRLASMERPGRMAAELALRILSGESPGAIPFVGEGEYVELYDGRELARWKIPDTAVPPGGVILYREPSLWVAHRWAFLGVFAAMALQSFLIVALVLHRSRRRRVERVLRLQKEELSRANRQLQEEASERERMQAALQAEPGGIQVACRQSPDVPGNGAPKGRARASRRYQPAACRDQHRSGEAGNGVPGFSGADRGETERNRERPGYTFGGCPFFIPPASPLDPGRPRIVRSHEDRMRALFPAAGNRGIL